MAKYYAIHNAEQNLGVVAEHTSFGRELSEEMIVNFLRAYYGAEVELLTPEDSRLRDGFHPGFNDKDMLADMPWWTRNVERVVLEESGLAYPEDPECKDRWYSGRQIRITGLADWPDLPEPSKTTEMSRGRLRPMRLHRQPVIETAE